MMQRRFELRGRRACKIDNKSERAAFPDGPITQTAVTPSHVVPSPQANNLLYICMPTTCITLIHCAYILPARCLET